MNPIVVNDTLIRIEKLLEKILISINKEKVEVIIPKKKGKKREDTN